MNPTPLDPSDPALLVGSVIGGVVYLVLVVGVYVWLAIALGRMFGKLGVEQWRAWVPVLNTVELYRLGGYSAFWVITLFLPIVQVAGLVVFYLSLHAITRRFGRGAGMTVLAILVLPVWASILGFGPAQPLPLGGGTDFGARMSGLQGGAGPLPPGAGWVPDAGAGAFPGGGEVRPGGSAGAAPAVPPTTPSAPSAAPALPEPPAIPERPAVPARPGPSAPTPAPPVASALQWAPPIESVPGLDVHTPPAQPAPAPAPAAPAPAQAAPAPAAPAPAASGPVPDDDVDQTVLSVRRRVRGWTLEAEGSAPVAITATTVLLGRNPAASGSDVTAQLVALADPSKTVSKTHARLEQSDGAWLVTDLGSTNGTVLVRASGEEVELTPGFAVTVDGELWLGQLAVGLREERS
ncbi:DUF5684 domain-containing protein [Galbitalea sp. SE-J8]|uniref:DUF5684 domain-containing protein n=1 Tax=Galbitalea sp. SE-J8 TaxID=3054952 RepID=UPI00259CC6B8|nr:DUF5684 domain-containing protein [Galbitalea sp. SE-J8]MDM4761535.1 DUF5684 domain-containing protein [Galbitalea sp. SE-J8]